MNLFWLQASGCGGCTQSMLGGDARRGVLEQLASAGLEFVAHTALREESGEEALDVLRDAASGALPIDVLCIEGAMLRGPNGTGRFHVMAGTGEPMIAWVRRLAKRAKYVLAIGSCTAFGGINASGENITEACGLQFDGSQRGGLLGSEFVSGSGLPVINVSGCPIHADWIIDTLMSIAGGALNAEDLDELQRPRFYSEQLVHHGCPKNEFYEFKASAQKASDLGCLMENLGCKGTQAHADCNTRPWYGVGSCIRGGFSCIACTEPGFEDPGHPFMETPKVAGIPIGLPLDMPKAWFVALAALSKSATPKRVRESATRDTPAILSSAKKLKGPRQ